MYKRSGNDFTSNSSLIQALLIIPVIAQQQPQVPLHFEQVAECGAMTDRADWLLQFACIGSRGVSQGPG